MSKTRPKWTDLEKPLNGSILKVLKRLKFKQTTPVQVTFEFLSFSTQLTVLFSTKGRYNSSPSLVQGCRC